LGNNNDNYTNFLLLPEHSLENLLCYLEATAITDFVLQLQAQGGETKSENLRKSVHKKLTKLIQKYLAHDSPQEVNLPAHKIKQVRNIPPAN